MTEARPSPLELIWASGRGRVMRVRGDEPCIGHLDLFMADRSAPQWKQREAVAIRMCRTCDRRIECYALAAQRSEEHGVWGGVSFRGQEGERRRDVSA